MILIYLAALGLRCAMWDRRFWYVGSGIEPRPPVLGA